MSPRVPLILAPHVERVFQDRKTSVLGISVIDDIQGARFGLGVAHSSEP